MEFLWSNASKLSNTTHSQKSVSKFQVYLIRSVRASSSLKTVKTLVVGGQFLYGHFWKGAGYPIKGNKSITNLGYIFQNNWSQFSSVHPHRSPVQQ